MPTDPNGSITPGSWVVPRALAKPRSLFRFARFVVAHPDRFGPDVAAAQDLSVPAEHPVARQMKAGGHPNVLHLRRPWDDKSKRFKTELPVDEIRRTVSFFGTTASAKAWRICIVDAADDMNISSANALLKVLEEPPERCLFLVLSHAPGRLLPTIRSRCRRIDLEPLSSDEICEGLRELAPDAVPSADDLRELAHTSDGSLRSAITLLSGDGLAIAKGLKKPRRKRFPARPGSHSRPCGPRGSPRPVRQLGEFLSTSSRSGFTNACGGICATALPVRTDTWSCGTKTSRAIRDADSLNLDRKQVVLDFFFSPSGQRDLCALPRPCLHVSLP
ncbi:DNA polymerase III subunit delta' [Roseibium salinum]|nr:DNA polymerase III subunit delta' [Roseibium salinum]